MGGIRFGGVSSGIAFLGARNGLSMSASQAVLGQDVGAAGNPALMTNSREIPYGANELTLNNLLGDKIRMGLVPGLAGRVSIKLEGNGASIPSLTFGNTTAPTNKEWRIEATNSDEFTIFDAGLFFRMSRVFSSISSSLHCYLPVQDNTTGVAFTTTVPRSRMVMTNRGAAANITFTLSAGVFIGIEYTFLVVTAFSILITAPGGVTIRNGGLVTAAGGTITGAAIGSCIRLMWASATEVVAVSVVGAWV